MIRRALGLSPKVGEHSVRITVEENTGTIRSLRNGVAVEHRFSADGPSESITVPISTLADCEAARDDPVRFSRQQDDTILVEWQHESVPIKRTAKQSDGRDEFPSPPESWHELPDGFLPALADAMATTDREATRYSIDCVQLCGATGRILATDSRKALVISGFDFPWDDQILLPWNGVFGLNELSRHGPVRIGRLNKTLSIATGPWTLHFSLETERRFPRIDDCIPIPGSEKTTLTITDDDAEFAVTSIKNLPRSEFDNSVTVVLGGTVTIRARGDGPATELVLSNSRCRGEPTWFCSDRDILRDAIQLGFRKFRIVAPDKVITSTDGNRTFLWMPIELPERPKADSEITRLTSSVTGTPTESTSPPTTRKEKCMAKNRIARNAPAESNGRDADRGDATNGINGIDALIGQAESLKKSLREMTQSVNDLISALKQHRQQTKKLRSAVLTLKQLQAIDA